MLATVYSSAILGVEALSIEIEVRIKEGKNIMTIIGLADSAIQESRGRILSCLEQSGFHCSGEVLVNLAPAELKKEGSSFDLPIAMGILFASKQVSNISTKEIRFVGELSLDGGIKPVKGIIAHVIEALNAGAERILVPRDNEVEARLINDIEVIGVRSLSEVVSIVVSGEMPSEAVVSKQVGKERLRQPFSDVHGQQLAKRALLIAAAGGHNLLMIGPPGCGKSMLAERFPHLLPLLAREEALEVAQIRSIAGLDINETVRGRRPFRSPHHVITQAGLIGGGSTTIRPGEVSLAHNGVLFLDEFPEYRRGVIEAMRAPLETGQVRVSRARGSVSFPARFQLLAAMNPCPCGRLGSTQSLCRCSRSRVQTYLQKLSQPILDRIDIHIELQPVSVTGMTSKVKSDNDDDLCAEVESCHRRQMARGNRNSNCTLDQLIHSSATTRKAIALLEDSADKMGFSARGIVRVLRVARTIADLAEEVVVTEETISEALQFRCLDRLSAYAQGL